MATAQIKINNHMLGTNEGEITRWYTLDTLERLVQTADPGDLLEVDCVTYKHWLIYAGVEMSSTEEMVPFVVHFDTEVQDSFLADKSTAQILKQPLMQVLYGNKKVRINNALDRRTCLVSPAANIILVNERIDEFVKEKKSYHMFHRNCEHFANFCRYGGKISNQSRIIWVTIVILCLDGLHHCWFVNDSAPTVTLLRRVTKLGVLEQYLFAWLAYALAAMHVVDLLAAFCMTFGFVKNTLFSWPHIVRTCVLMTITAYLTIYPTEISNMELGPGASWASSGLFSFLLVLYFGFSTNAALNEVNWIIGVMLSICVAGPKFTATLVLLMYIYETIRLSPLDTTNNLDFINFTLVVCYLVHAIGVVFPIVLVITIIIDDVIRLKFAAHQGVLNGIASVLIFRYLTLVFDCQHATILIALCIVELYYTEMYTLILGEGPQRIWRHLKFRGWASNLGVYCWQHLSAKNTTVLVSVIILVILVNISPE